MKKLILIRHGNTPKKDRSTQRGITKKGIRTIIESSNNVRKELDKTESCLILSTPTTRSIQTADILALELGIKRRMVEDLRIHHLGNLSKELDLMKSKRMNLCEYYWGIGNYNENGVESPESFVKRVEVILSGYFRKGCNCIIIVTHEISLETIVRYSDEYVLKNKSYDVVTGYGDFAVLKSKSNFYL